MTLSKKVIERITLYHYLSSWQKEDSTCIRSTITDASRYIITQILKPKAILWNSAYFIHSQTGKQVELNLSNWSVRNISCFHLPCKLPLSNPLLFPLHWGVQVRGGEGIWKCPTVLQTSIWKELIKKYKKTLPAIYNKIGSKNILFTFIFNFA